MKDKKEVFDTKTLFLYEIGKQISSDYYLAIVNAYSKVFGRDKDMQVDLSPAEIIDDLAMVMYEVENEVFGFEREVIDNA